MSAALESGTLTLERRSDPLGYLPAILNHLAINPDTQMLVFSKTSVQAARVSPQSPRAVYFNDEAAVAYVPGAETIELAAMDPAQGPVFYALSSPGTGPPTLARSESCLRCHLGPNTAGVPGMYVGSVIPGPTGAPLRDESAIITDHRSAFAERWGGWYVTARKGEQPDRANAVAPNPADPGSLERESRQNLASLAGLLNLAPYLAQTSDIVALMTFEHQTQMANLITRVGWQARIAAHGDPDADLTTGPAADDIEGLVAYMLFEGEVALTTQIEGVSTFTRTFAARGPRDRKGRSLRDLDLQTRLFRHQLSYMIYSPMFDALPAAARARVYRRLHEILTGRDRSGKFAYLKPEGRRAILEILRETKKGLPDYFLK